jgi:hypothetical protein
MQALKETLLKDMEGEIDVLVAARSAKEQLTLTEIEEVVLEARQRLGQKLVERLIEMQERAQGAEIPVSAVTGKRLHAKGKKTGHSSGA